MEKLGLKLGKYDDDVDLGFLHVELMCCFTNQLVWRIVEQAELCFDVAVM